MTHKPIIGIPAEIRIVNGLQRNSVNQADISAVTAAGGVAVPIPTRQPELMSTYLNLCAGIMLPGGPDVAPRFYGEEPLSKLGDTDALLDESEIQLVKLAAANKVPLLGLCRGMQIINVALGGSVYQDLESQRDRQTFQHFQKAPMNQGTHTISITPETQLESIIGGGDQTLVNSHHHEAVKALAPGLKLTALAKDGVIEGLESENDDLILAVQWHPEFMFENNEQMAALFKNFIHRAEAAKK
ncbi:gamma-glutamyl-gamma-aminobutyrate hydrolase family protein [Lentilactobacillus kisonensis]|uniref:Peptidase C26 n=2 Tax=Lentilactobacillus kisonensis TaxID=481722 RepID=H1LHR9_9LACO|nr:gamma-glutamyl-gamma-aminobutyrate hydrolase family protein [Lentilactobacillus kisonensis]EHO50203.1 peptidase C26 [Lentilactobacillus kisonensis F0435]KRL20806.1 peptidase C26 [Lentilactobacillus kisonensis DSM 19906 = JCM 15041]